MVTLKYLHLLLYAGIAHRNLHKETVRLSFWQFIRALLLHWVLRGQNGIDITHAIGGAVNGYLSLLHHLKEGGLRLCRRTVDLIDQHDIGEHRSLMELELTGLHIKHRRTQHVARHEVGRELHTAELRVNELGDGTCQQRLCYAGHTLNEHVSVSQDCRQDEVHSQSLAHDDLRDTFTQQLNLLGKLRQVCTLNVGNRGNIHFFHSLYVFNDPVHLIYILFHLLATDFRTIFINQPTQTQNQVAQGLFLHTSLTGQRR